MLEGQIGKLLNLLEVELLGHFELVVLPQASAHLLELRYAGLPATGHFYQVQAEGRAHDIAPLALGQAEGRFLEGRVHHATREPSERAAPAR